MGFWGQHVKAELRWFETFEEREAYFKAHVSGLVPETYRGAREFWRQFGAVKTADVIAQSENGIAFIPSFPQDGLAFSSPSQVLRAAAMGAPDAGELERETAELFKISHLLDQALRTLSGGETIRLALAKVYLNARTHRKLSIASPFSWLDRKSMGLINTTADAYLGQDKPAEFLALAGENEVVPLPMSLTATGPAFAIRMRNLAIELSQSFSLGADPLRTVVRDGELNLRSPCIIQGENGAGKSLFSKTLADVVGYRGELAVDSGANDGPSRLLHQNTLSQSLFRVGAEFAPLGEGEVFEEFNSLKSRLQAALAEKLGGFDDKSILGVKTSLCAARLCGRPKVFILDEPEWGLNHVAASRLVGEICEAAHDKGVPVMIVSHKTWFSDLAASGITVSKHPADTKDAVFAIEVTEL